MIFGELYVKSGEYLSISKKFLKLSFDSISFLFEHSVKKRSSCFFLFSKASRFLNKIILYRYWWYVNVL